MKEEKPIIEVKIQYDDYDINITDSKHNDNSITITREEASWVLFKLKEILE